MKTAHLMARLFAGALLFGGIQLTARAQVTFTALGDLAGGAFQSQALAVSADGKIVVGQVTSAAGVLPAVWNDGGLSTLALPQGAWTATATGVSLDGKVITGTGTFGNVVKAIVWMDGVPTELGVLPDAPFSELLSRTGGVSADGGTIVGASASDLTTSQVAVKWESGAVNLLGDFPGGSTDSSARAVSADGSVIVGYGSGSDGVQAARWVNGVMTSLGELPGGPKQSRANAVSADGAYIVGESLSDQGREPFLWFNGQMIGLGGLKKSYDGEARGVSLGGERVVGMSFSFEGPTAFIWDPQNGMRTLEEDLLAAGLIVGGWHLSVATAITPDGGTIVGYGYNLNGQTEAWKVTLDPLPQLGAVPEPSAYSAVAALALIGLIARRRWRRKL